MKILISLMKKTLSIELKMPREKQAIEKSIWILLDIPIRPMLKQKSPCLSMFSKNSIQSVTNSSNQMIMPTEELAAMIWIQTRTLTQRIRTKVHWVQAREFRRIHHSKKLRFHRDHSIPQRICTNNSQIKMHINKTTEAWETDSQSSSSNHLLESAWTKAKTQETMVDRSSVLELQVQEPMHQQWIKIPLISNNLVQVVRKDFKVIRWDTTNNKSAVKDSLVKIWISNPMLQVIIFEDLVLEQANKHKHLKSKRP